MTLSDGEVLISPPPLVWRSFRRWDCCSRPALVGRERNYFAQTWPAFGALVTNNFARGAISGLGLVNLVAGFSELVPVFGARRPRHDVPIGEGADPQVEP